MVIADLAITSLETITCFDISSGDWLFTLDELQNASIANSEEKEDITGKQGRKLTSLKRNKAATVSGTNGLLSCGLLASQVGSEFEEKTYDFVWYESLTVASAAAATTYVATGDTGAEITALYIKDSATGILTTQLTQSSETSSTTFTYDPATKALAFDASVADGTEVVVYYTRKVNAAVLENKSDVYSGKVDMYIDALAEDRCATTYRVQIHIPKADFSGEFTLDLGDSQTTHSFEAEALAGSCGSSGNLWDYAVIGANAEDVTE